MAPGGVPADVPLGCFAKDLALRDRLGLSRLVVWMLNASYKEPISDEWYNSRLQSQVSTQVVS
jgi:hypothetical protein